MKSSLEVGLARVEYRMITSFPSLDIWTVTMSVLGDVRRRDETKMGAHVQSDVGSLGDRVLGSSSDGELEEEEEEERHDQSRNSKAIEVDERQIYTHSLAGSNGGSVDSGSSSSSGVVHLDDRDGRSSPGENRSRESDDSSRSG